jgi:hypothetical protein
MLVLMFFSGSTYLFAFTVLFLGIDSLVRYKKGIKIFAIVIILTLILSSIKVFPLIEFLNHPQLVSSSLDQDTGFGYNGIGFFKAIVTPPGRYNYQDKIDQNKYYWFEYSMYLGWIGLALIIGGIWVAYKKRASYLITLIITIIISFGENFPINIWKLIHLLPFFESLKVPSRLNIFIIFLLAIFIAESIDYLKKYKWIQILASIALVMSLLLTNISIYKGAFDINPPPVIDAEFSQGINTDTLTTNPLTGWSYEMYSFFLQNKGTINCYEKLRWDTNVEESQVEVDYWSPNKVVVSEETTLNQNFATGWHGENKNDLLVGKDVVYYLPSSFIIGSVITFTVLLISILIFRKKWK